jgi:hypothetical protein
MKRMHFKSFYEGTGALKVFSFDFATSFSSSSINRAPFTPTMALGERADFGWNFLFCLWDIMPPPSHPIPFDRGDSR